MTVWPLISGAALFLYLLLITIKLYRVTRTQRFLVRNPNAIPITIKGFESDEFPNEPRNIWVMRVDRKRPFSMYAKPSLLWPVIADRIYVTPGWHSLHCRYFNTSRNVKDIQTSTSEDFGFEFLAGNCYHLYFNKTSGQFYCRVDSRKQQDETTRPVG